MKLKHKEHKKRIFLLVTMLDKHKIILEMPWMWKHKINFDWKHEELLFTADVCWKHYMNLKPDLKFDLKSDLKLNTKSEPIWNLKMKPTKAQTLYLSNKKHDHWKYSFKRAIQQPEPEYETKQPESDEEPSIEDEQMNIYAVKAASLARLAWKPEHKIFIITMTDIEKAFASKKYMNSAVKLLKKYHEFLDVFSQKQADMLLKHRTYDHRI